MDGLMPSRLLRENPTRRVALVLRDCDLLSALKIGSHVAALRMTANPLTLLTSKEVH